MKKLAIVTTHPIQYNAPLFKLLTERHFIELKVFYTWGQSKSGEVYDPGFGKSREWDIPLLSNYNFEFIKNVSYQPGSHHFWGIINPNLIDKIEAYHPDAILVYGWSFYSHLKVLFHFKNKIKIYFRGDSTLLDEADFSGYKNLLRKLFLKSVYRYIDFALYVGKENKKYFLASGLKENQLVYCPHSIDNGRFIDNHDTHEQTASTWRNKLNIPDDAIVFLFAGKLEAKKNPYLIIEAFRSLTNQNIRLILTGNGILENDLKQISKEDSRILFLDFQNQSVMPVVYRLGDVFVLPSRGPGETWGLSVNEAMACGRSVIISDKCGCAQDLNIANNSVFPSDNKLILIQFMKSYIDMGKKVLNNKKLEIQRQIDSWSLDRVASIIENLISC